MENYEDLIKEINASNEDIKKVHIDDYPKNEVSFDGENYILVDTGEILEEREGELYTNSGILIPKEEEVQ